MIDETQRSFAELKMTAETAIRAQGGSDESQELGERWLRGRPPTINPKRLALLLVVAISLGWVPSGTQRPNPARTSRDEPVVGEEAIRRLKAGNKRFVMGRGRSAPKRFRDISRQALAAYGQRPLASIITCSDSRVLVESIFDAQPGDIFVFRNAGNTAVHSEGGMIGSIEFSVEHLGSKLVIVMGHTKCGAIAGATHAMLEIEARRHAKNVTELEDVEVRLKEFHEIASDHHEAHAERRSELEELLNDLVPVAALAAQELIASARPEEIAAHAVQVNVFHTIDIILSRSSAIRKRVASGDVQVLGAIYDLESGEVHFLGESPRQEELLS